VRTSASNLAKPGGAQGRPKTSSGKEMRISALEPGCEDDNVAFDDLFYARTPCWDTLMAVRESDARGFESVDVATELAGLGLDLRQDLIIANSGAHEMAFVLWYEALEVLVKEVLEEKSAGEGE
jgi:hypothetical protein